MRCPKCQSEDVSKVETQKECPDNSNESNEPLIMFFITPTSDNIFPEYIVVTIKGEISNFKFFVNAEEVSHEQMMTEIHKREFIYYTDFIEMINNCE
tara:strand:+ start:417 stop:707 length:291 start_codon:yes stop_codon:yes gene_type:complete